MTKLVIHHYIKPAAAPRRARSLARDCGGGCGCRKCREYPRGRDVRYTESFTKNFDSRDEGLRWAREHDVFDVVFVPLVERRPNGAVKMKYKQLVETRDYDDPDKSRTALEGPDGSIKLVPVSRA